MARSITIACYKDALNLAITYMYDVVRVRIAQCECVLYVAAAACHANKRILTSRIARAIEIKWIAPIFRQYVNVWHGVGGLSTGNARTQTHAAACIQWRDEHRGGE